MTISTVALTNTFDEWRIRTNQVITSLNTINEGNNIFTGTVIITNPNKYQGNVSLNVSSGMIKGDGGLLSNLQSSVVAAAAFEKANLAASLANGAPSGSVVNVAFSVANAAFDAANGTPSGSRVNVISQVANAAYDTANSAYDKANQSGATVSTSAPSGPGNGSLWWNSTYGKLLIYYTDGSSSQWVDVVATPDVSPIFARTNAVYSVTNSAYTIANAAFGQANNALTLGSAAFDKANTFIAGIPTVTDDTTTDAARYVMFTPQTSGNATINVSSTGLTFNPSTGTLSATVFNSLSDATLKENVAPIDNALDIINSISGVGFDWKQTGKHSYGVVAQNMEKVVPDLVDRIDDLKTVNYDGIIAFLIEAIKELNKKIENKE